MFILFLIIHKYYELYYIYVFKLINIKFIIIIDYILSPENKMQITKKL